MPIRGFTLAAAVSAGLAAAVADAAPTGLGWWDATLRFGLGFLVVIAAAKAPAWTVVGACLLAVAGAGFSGWAPAAWISLGLGLVSALADRDDRVLEVIAMAVAVPALLGLPAFGFFGLPSIVAGAGFVLVLVGGYRGASRRTRGAVKAAVSAAVLFVVVTGVVGGLALLGARDDVERGIEAAEAGLAAARSADTAGVVDELILAEQALVSASERIDGPGLWPARFVPVAAQHQRALSRATGQGAVVAREASAAVREADIDSITLSAGRVDLDAVVAMAPRLASTAAALHGASAELASIDGDWLLPLVIDRLDELRDEVDQVIPDADLAAEAAAVVPGLLGADGTVRYFVIFGTPAEARELGGLLGSWAVIEFTDGVAAIGESGRVGDLYEVARAKTLSRADGPSWLLEMAQPTQWPQNLTSSPQFSTVRDLAQIVLAGGPGQPVDGYVYLDTWALIGLLQLTGPIDMPFADGPLSYETGAEFFFDGQYRVATSRDAMFAQLAVMLETIVGRLDQVDLPGPAELGRLLGPDARAGRIQVITFDDRANAFLERVKLLRTFGRRDTQDYLAIVHTNGTESKLELHLTRSVTYDVEVGVGGELRATARVELVSDVPPDAPDYVLGEGLDGDVHQVLLSLYSPHSVVAARLDGERLGFRTVDEFGLARYLVDVAVPWTGEPMVVEFDLQGVVLPELGYSLEVWHQPLVNHDQVQVIYRGPDGVINHHGPLVENTVLSVG